MLFEDVNSVTDAIIDGIILKMARTRNVSSSELDRLIVYISDLRKDRRPRPKQ
ncbi:MAG: hypothetical protein IIC84_08080 [Chloroflexi bacterium]|nr:hypothetical protein [Chloroflexota bacterium]